jgi:glycerol kinase
MMLRPRIAQSLRLAANSRALSVSTKKYVGAIDQGTSSTRFVIFDRKGEIVAVDQREFTQILPEAGFVEHSPQEIWQTTKDCISGAMQKAGAVPEEIAAVGITNQRETTVVWDKTTGEPIANAPVWSSAHTQDICAKLEREGGKDRFRAKTGLPVATYFSGSKIQWLLDNVPGARAKAEAGELLFGNTDAWLTWNLTGGVNGGVHATDVTNASRVQLMDLATLAWDDDLCDAFNVPASMLPEIRPSSGDFGVCAGEGVGVPELAGVPISGVLGDQQAALFGQAGFNIGDAKNTYGTECMLLQQCCSREHAVCYCTPLQATPSILALVLHA